jgi:hypothetical protein
VCHFWDESRELWSTDGCVTLGDQAPNDSALVVACSCSHLTEFAGLSVPTSIEELEDDLAAFTISTVGADDFAVLLAPASSAASNPSIYWAIGALAVGNICTLLLFAAVDARAAQRAAAAEAARAAKGGFPAGRGAVVDEYDLAAALEGRLDQLDDLIADHASRAAADIQRIARGCSNRKRGPMGSSCAAGVGGAAVGAMPAVAAPGLRGAWRWRGGDRSREHVATRLLRAVLTSLKNDRTLLGLFFDLSPMMARTVELSSI